MLECVPTSLAERISKALRIPVIGIGAGPATDGQILVMHDAFGITSGYVPKFTKTSWPRPATCAPPSGSM